MRIALLLITYSFELTDAFCLYAFLFFLIPFFFPSSFLFLRFVLLQLVNSSASAVSRVILFFPAYFPFGRLGRWSWAFSLFLCFSLTVCSTVYGEGVKGRWRGALDLTSGFFSAFSHFLSNFFFEPNLSYSTNLGSSSSSSSLSSTYFYFYSYS